MRLPLALACLLLVPAVAAQVPPLPGAAQPPGIGFHVVCPTSFFYVDFKGVAETTCQFHDLSRDSAFLPESGSGTSASNHMTTFSVVPTGLPEHVFGWQVLVSDPFIPSYGGDIKPFSLRITNLPTIRSATFPFDLVANFTGPNNEKLNQTIHMLAQVKRFDQALVATNGSNQIQSAGQDELVRYTLSVENTGLYPDVYRFEVTPSSNVVKVTPPLPVYVPPGETRTVSFTVLTPKGALYDLGTNVQFNIKAISTTGTGVYTAFAALQVEGPYVPIYWIPLTLVGFIAAVVVVRRSKERAELRRLELGRPRRVEVTPRQAVLLAELKRKDPEAFKQRRAQLQAIYDSRREDYRGFHKERMAHDKDERRQAQVEYNEAKKRRKLERKAALVQKSADKKAVKAQNALDKKAAKVERKEMAAKEKALQKRRKKLEKAQAKQAKVDAKQAARDAKAQALADKAAAKEAKRLAKEAKKAKASSPDQEKP